MLKTTSAEFQSIDYGYQNNRRLEIEDITLIIR